MRGHGFGRREPCSKRWTTERVAWYQQRCEVARQAVKSQKEGQYKPPKQNGM